MRSYIEPHEYGLREALKAWMARLTRGEKLFKIWFYSDELAGAELSGFLERTVEELGGTCQKSGRYLIVRGMSSWRDIGVDKSQGLAPSSGSTIMCQGGAEFVDRMADILREERAKRRQPGKKRTSLAGALGKGMWRRS